MQLNSISDFAPSGTEAGVGLALLDERGRYVFFLAGTRHKCPPDEIFYAGIGGHKEPGENWIQCANREAWEEIGAEVEILSSWGTWVIRKDEHVERVTLSDQPSPLCLYEMVHPVGTPREGELYRIVIYNARLRGQPGDLPPEEIGGVIALTKRQVIGGLNRKPTLTEILSEGGQLVAGGEDLPGYTRLYPLGTSRALGEIFHYVSEEG